MRSGKKSKQKERKKKSFECRERSFFFMKKKGRVLKRMKSDGWPRCTGVATLREKTKSIT